MLRYIALAVARIGWLVLPIVMLLGAPGHAVAQSKPVAQPQSDPIIAQQHEALALYTAGKYQATLDILLKNVDLARTQYGENSSNHAWVLNLIANSYQAIYRNAEAVTYYKRALEIREKSLGADHIDVARSLTDLGGFYKTLTRHVEAEQMLKRALAIREKAHGEDNADVAQTVNDLADIYFTLGRYAQAEALFKRGLAIREKVLGPDDIYVAESLSNLASLYGTLGRDKEAETSEKRALAIWEKASGSGHRTVAYALIGLSNIYLASDRVREAEPLLKRAIDNFENAFGPDHPDVAAPLNGLAIVYYRLGRYAQAEMLLKRSLAIREKVFGSEHPNVAETLNTLANQYMTLRRYSESITLHRRALAIREKVYGADHPSVSGSLNNLGRVYEKSGRYAEAEPLLKRALAIKEKVYGPEHPSYAVTLHNLGSIALKTGRPRDARDLHQRSLAIRQRDGLERSDVAASLNGLAQVYLALGDMPAALDHARRSVRTFIGLLDKDQRRADDDALPVRENLDQGITILRRAVNGGPAEATVAAEAFEVAQWATQSAAATALAQMAARFGAGSDALSALVRAQQDAASEWNALDKLLLAELSKPSEKRDGGRETELRRTLNKLDTRVEHLRKRLGTEFPRYSELVSPKPVLPASVQQLLGPDEALVLFHVGDDASFVWAVTRERIEWREIILPRTELDALVTSLRASLDPTVAADRARPFDFDAAHKLYSAILGPVESAVVGKRHLIAIPSGALASLPLHVLVTAKPAKRIEGQSDYRQAAWLARRHAVTVLPSVASLKTLRDGAGWAAAPKAYLGFGDPVFDPNPRRTRQDPARQSAAAGAGKQRANVPTVQIDIDGLSRALAPLPDTADELYAVARTLGVPLTEVRLGNEATEHAVKAARLEDYRILHFATHALVANETALFAARAEPALALTLPLVPSERDDGLLTSSEVAALRLNADWVILSACNTAAGDKPGSEALSGLARAFFYAGAKTLLVSHWPVQSDAAVRLTTRTIQTLEQDRTLSAAEALRRAMVAFLEDDSHAGNAHPAVWAPFVIVGTKGAGQ